MSFYSSRLPISKSYTDITAEINRGILELRKSAPDVMAGFTAMARGALKPGTLSEVHKELIALAIGVAGHCDGCIGFHAKSLVRLGAKREEVVETLAVAVYMGGGPSLMYAAEAIHAFDEFAAPASEGVASSP
ncbi:MAG: carboxymuconolactone decarboxylase family protein [Nitrosospira sp.]